MCAENVIEFMKKNVKRWEMNGNKFFCPAKRRVLGTCVKYRYDWEHCLFFQGFLYNSTNSDCLDNFFIWLVFFINTQHSDLIFKMLFGLSSFVLLEILDYLGVKEKYISVPRILMVRILANILTNKVPDFEKRKIEIDNLGELKSRY